jgi:hypothetical protein
LRATRFGASHGPEVKSIRAVHRGFRFTSSAKRCRKKSIFVLLSEAARFIENSTWEDSFYVFPADGNKSSHFSWLFLLLGAFVLTSWSDSPFTI